MQVNSDKRKQKEITKINNLKLRLLENDLDFNFIFETYLNKVYKNANQKINLLARTTPYVTFEKTRAKMQAFITSHVAYCPIF